MGPLGFVNWHTVNIRFRFLMWLLAIALAVVVLVQIAGPPVDAQPKGNSPAVAAPAIAAPAMAGGGALSTMPGRPPPRRSPGGALARP